MVISMVKKLYIAVISMILLVVTLTTSTFAWVEIAETNRVDGFEMSALTTSNLEFSLDSENFYSSITKEMLSKTMQDLKFEDLSSKDGINFVSSHYGSQDDIRPNKNYISLKLYVRTISRYHDVYLVNNNTNNINYFDEYKSGTYVTSKGVTFSSSVSFQYSNDEIVFPNEPKVYYARDAVRISFNEIKTDNEKDIRLDNEYAGFIFDPTGNEERGYGKPYGSIDYFNQLRFDYIDLPVDVPDTLYELSRFDPVNNYLPLSTDSRVMTLIESDRTDSKGYTYYEGVTLLTVWLEGYDADMFDAIFNDTIQINLEPPEIYAI